MQDLLIFPYSGTAIEALDCLGDQWRCTGFISDDQDLVGEEKSGVRIYDRSELKVQTHAKLLAVNGSPASFTERQSIIEGLNIKPERFANIIHPSASIGKHVKLGYNVLIMAGVVVTANAVIGDHVIILPNSVVHHDSFIGDYTLIAANVTVAGNVTVKSNSYLGAGSSMRNGIILSEGTLVGMGANVLSNFPAGSILIGNPARQLEKNI